MIDPTIITWQYVSAGTSSGSILVFSRVDGRIRLTKDMQGPHKVAVTALASSCDQAAGPNHMASADESGTVVLWDTSLMAPLAVLPGPHAGLVFRRS